MKQTCNLEYYNNEWLVCKSNRISQLQPNIDTRLLTYNWIIYWKFTEIPYCNNRVKNKILFNLKEDNLLVEYTCKYINTYLPILLIVIKKSITPNVYRSNHQKLIFSSKEYYVLFILMFWKSKFEF